MKMKINLPIDAEDFITFGIFLRYFLSMSPTVTTPIFSLFPIPALPVPTFRKKEEGMTKKISFYSIFGGMLFREKRNLRISGLRNDMNKRIFYKEREIDKRCNHFFKQTKYKTKINKI